MKPFGTGVVIIVVVVGVVLVVGVGVVLVVGTGVVLVVGVGVVLVVGVGVVVVVGTGVVVVIIGCLHVVSSSDQTCPAGQFKITFTLSEMSSKSST